MSRPRVNAEIGRKHAQRMEHRQFDQNPAEALEVSVSVSFTNFVFDNDFQSFDASRGDL